MIIIKLFTTSGEKYARKPFIFPISKPCPIRVPVTLFRSQAKQFKTVKQAHAWLARRGFAGLSGYRSIRVSEKYPEPFTGFELISFDSDSI